MPAELSLGGKKLSNASRARNNGNAVGASGDKTSPFHTDPANRDRKAARTCKTGRLAITNESGSGGAIDVPTGLMYVMKMGSPSDDTFVVLGAIQSIIDKAIDKPRVDRKLT